jgi:predicted TIM-barrel fold metal-dependent hydrolase
MHGRRIDFHHHMMPPAYMEEAKQFVVEAATGIVSDMSWSPEMSLARMDAAGIDAAVLSMATPGIWFGDRAQAERLARVCAEFGAETKAQWPRRFAYLAPLPLPGVEDSLKTIDLAFDRLDADGICLLSSYGDTWLGDPSFDRVFDALDRRKAIVFVHPTTPPACRNIVRGLPDAILEFLFDSTRAITNLLYSGTFTRCPNIRFVFTHGAAALPGLAHRIGHALTRLPHLAARVPEGAPAVLSRLHFDVTNSGSRMHLAALAHLVPPENLLYGSDYPFIDVGVTWHQLADAGLDEAGLERIASVNALRLIPRLA